MNFKKWSILIVIMIFIVFLSFKFLVTKEKVFDIKNQNNEHLPATNSIRAGNYMKIESDVFVNNGKIPVRYTCNGERIQIPIKMFDVPKDAKSLALIVDDPDASNGDFVHWVIWNIDPKTSVIENGSLPKSAVEGYTSLNKSGWVPPCPPSGTHHYHFKLSALDTVLS